MNGDTLSCPAKVNLALSVGSPDQHGMHPIASWMIAVQFADTLHLSQASGDISNFDIRFADDAPQPKPIDWPIEKDLSYRAHALLEKHVERKLPIDVTLIKRIPTGAGLGGGSSNAAGILVGVNDLYQLNLSANTLMELSRELGSDVAFAVAAMQGQTSAIVTGLGEQMAPAPRQDSIHLVLILPPLHCPTGSVYQAFDVLQPTAEVDEARVRTLVTLDPLPADALFNDLMEAAKHVEPKLDDAIKQLQNKLNLIVHVTGSGAAMFIITASQNTGETLAHKINATTAWPAVATGMSIYRG